MYEAMIRPQIEQQLWKAPKPDAAVPDVPALEKPPRPKVELQRGLSALLELPIVSSWYERTFPGMLQGSSRKDAESHLTVSLKNICNDASRRIQLLREIDERTAKESIELKKRESITTDIFIIGSGPQGTAFAEKFKHLFPDASFLFADKSPVIGGQFRANDEQYDLNSMNVAKKALGLSYEKGQPNDLGEHAVIQTTDISAAEYPRSNDIGLVSAVNNYKAAPSLVNTQVVSVEKNSNNNIGQYTVNAIDLDTKKPIKIYTNMVIGSTGMGNTKTGIDMNTPETKKALERNAGTTMTFPELLNLLKTEHPQRLRKIFTKGIAILGGEDSAAVTSEKIIAKIKELSLSYVDIDIFGAKYKNAEEFLNGTIDRYKHLSEYIEDPDTKERVIFHMKRKSRIKPHIEKVSGLLDSFKGVRLTLEDDSVSRKSYGLVVFATGYQNNTPELFTGIISEKGAAIPVYDAEGKVILGKQIPGENIYHIGPAAEIPYSEQDLQKVPANMQHRYKNALRRLIPLTEKLAEQLAIKQKGQTASIALAA
jgi:hypothetical protein